MFLQLFSTELFVSRAQLCVQFYLWMLRQQVLYLNSCLLASERHLSCNVFNQFLVKSAFVNKDEGLADNERAEYFIDHSEL